MMPDGQQAHARIESISGKQVRIQFEMPDQLRVGRDTKGAAKIFGEKK